MGRYPLRALYWLTFYTALLFHMSHSRAADLTALEEARGAKYAELRRAEQELRNAQRLSTNNGNDKSIGDNTEDPCSCAPDVTRWLKDRGVDMRYVEIRPSRVPGKGSGVGVYAKRTIPENTQFISIPDKVAITRTVIDSSPLGDMFRQEKITDSRLMLALYALFSRHHQSSPHHPYVCSWPRQYSNAINLTPDHLQALKNTIALEYVQLAKAQFERAYSFLEARACVKYAELFSSRMCTREEFVWAWSGVETRSYKRPHDAMSQQEKDSLPLRDRANDKALIPLSSSMNHSPRGGIPMMYQAKTSSFQYATGVGIRRGSEVFSYYSELSDTESFVKYGFVWNRIKRTLATTPDAEVDNPHDNVKWTHHMWTGVLPDYQRRNEIATKLGLEYPYDIPSFAQFEFPHALVLVIHIYNLSPSDIVNYGINDTYAIAAMKDTIRALEDHITRYPATTSTDSAILRSQEPGGCADISIQDPGHQLYCDVLFIRHREHVTFRLALIQVAGELPYMIEEYCSTDERTRDIWTCPPK